MEIETRYSHLENLWYLLLQFQCIYMCSFTVSGRLLSDRYTNGYSEVPLSS